MEIFVGVYYGATLSCYAYFEDFLLGGPDFIPWISDFSKAFFLRHYERRSFFEAVASVHVSFWSSFLFLEPKFFSTCYTMASLT